jgi:hypothetical protein
LSVANAALQLSQLEYGLRDLVAMATRCIWQRLHDAFRAKTRRQGCKKSTPTVAILNSQSAHTTEGGLEWGDLAMSKVRQFRGVSLQASDGRAKVGKADVRKPLIDQFIIKGNVLLICAVSISTYATIVFGTGVRFAQVVGVPCVGLIGIALGRMILRIDPRTHRRLALGLLTSLVCLLLGEVYGVQSNFGSVRGVYVDDVRPTQVADLSRKRAWRELIEYVERQGPISDSNVLRQLGRAHAMLGHVDEAEECYKKALAKAPLDVDCRYLLVQLYLKRGRVGDAEVECLRILNVSDSIPEAHMAYAIVLEKRGDDTNAVAEIARSLSLLPLDHPWKNMNPRSVLGQLLQSTNP